MKLSGWKIGYAAVVLLCTAYGFTILRGPHGIPGLVEKRQQIHDLEKQNSDLNREIERKRLHIQRLTESPAEQELELRQRLKFVKPGEKVYVTPAPAKVAHQ